MLSLDLHRTLLCLCSLLCFSLTHASSLGIPSFNNGGVPPQMPYDGGAYHRQEYHGSEDYQASYSQLNNYPGAYSGPGGEQKHHQFGQRQQNFRAFNYLLDTPLAEDYGLKQEDYGPYHRVSNFVKSFSSANAVGEANPHHQHKSWNGFNIISAFNHYASSMVHALDDAVSDVAPSKEGKSAGFYAVIIVCAVAGAALISVATALMVRSHKRKKERRQRAQEADSIALTPNNKAKLQPDDGHTLNL